MQVHHCEKWPAAAICTQQCLPDQGIHGRDHLCWRLVSLKACGTCACTLLGFTSCILQHVTMLENLALQHPRVVNDNEMLTSSRQSLLSDCCVGLVRSWMIPQTRAGVTLAQTRRSLASLGNRPRRIVLRGGPTCSTSMAGAC